MCTFPHAYLSKILSADTVAEKRARGRCISWGCSRRARKETRDPRCHTCRSRITRLKNPARYSFRNLKNRAKQRGIAFELTFDEFAAFCNETDYLEKKGREPHSYTIDRIKTHLPYCYSNLRILTHAQNSSHKYEDGSAPADF